MELISWESLEDYIKEGIPAQLPVSIGSDISFLIGDCGKSLGLRLPSIDGQDIAPSPFQELDISQRIIDKGTVIELTVFQDKLYGTFYHFCIDIVQQILLHGTVAKAAIERSLGNWAQLLLRKTFLASTEQIGLAGELCFLKALLEKRGAEAFNSWLGPIREPHDFRLDSSEFEVKSTTQVRRTHRIHGLGQLEPSIGMQLYMLSLQFEPAGNAKTGKSLVDRINGIRNLLTEADQSLRTFEFHLKSLGYDDSDSNFYLEKLKFRSPPVLIPVTAGFPRLTRALVEQVLPQDVSQRVSYVEYELDVEGLGYFEGSPEYKRILSGLTLQET
jgi:hypothetical protein